MSEYQYYEFLAIDKPLDARQIEALRASSTRATITPTQFANEYYWGDFRGDVRAFLTRYFDIMVYVANWGTRRFICRLPADAVGEPSDLAAYETETVVTFDHIKRQVLVELAADDECPEVSWCEGERWMASLSLLRAELIAGDWRGLYLAWLRAVEQDEVDDEVFEPTVPSGLKQLSTAQQTLAQFLDIDQDLLAAAQQASEDLHEPVGADQWLASLPIEDKDRLVKAVWEGQAAKVQAELWRRWRQDVAAIDASPPAPRRSVSQLCQLADDLRSNRERAEATRQARLKAERAAKQAAAREVHLKALARQPDKAWADIEHWIDSRLPHNYDMAVACLADLAQLAQRQNDQASFDQRLAALIRQHARKSTLMKRLALAGLK